ncbi:MAG: isochorismatase family protein [Xanthomonadales bacterium]|nr:isochorismatase family protein [Xanthomonadales bacterium]
MQSNLSCLLVVDIQQRLVPAIDAVEPLLRNADILCRAARRLQVPLLASEQYPRGLGHTVPQLAELLQPAEVLEKTEFSCARNSALMQRLTELDRKQVIVVGMEAHVCVLQTVLGLLDQGLNLFVVSDAVGSRQPESKARALDRAARAGASVVTTEMVVFEWLEHSGSDAFRELSRLIR